MAKDLPWVHIEHHRPEPVRAGLSRCPFKVGKPHYVPGRVLVDGKHLGWVMYTYDRRDGGLIREGTMVLVGAERYFATVNGRKLSWT